MRILFTGGGTGGHIYPIVAVARALKELPLPAGETLDLYYAGPTDFSVADLIQEGIKISGVSAGKARRYFSMLNAISPVLTFLGFFKALFVLWRIMPDVIWAKGGYGSVPIGLAGWIYKIPLFIHESDAVPGISNRLLGYLAARIAVAFPEAAATFPAQKTAVTGNPIRQAIVGGSRDEAKKLFGLVGEKPLLLILGGSQGSRRINALVAQSLGQLLARFEIIHQCGTANFDGLKEELASVYRVSVPGTLNYHLVPLLDELSFGQALAAAALVISRAGAGSIFDIAAAGRASILIPLKESARNHQVRNAFDYARAGAAQVIQESNLTPHLLENEINRIVNDEKIKSAMEQAARAFARPDAAAAIARELVNLVIVRLPELKANGAGRILKQT